MLRKLPLLVLPLLLLLPAAVRAQDQLLAPAGADSIPIFQMTDVFIEDEAPTPAQEERARKRMFSEADRLRYNIYKVYPLARQAAAIIQRVDAEMTRMGTRSDQKAYMRRLEKELFQRYERQLRRLSVNQGRLLIKLIDRETGDSAYELIKNYKSGSSAVLWQLVARLFGSNLKDGYDAGKEPAIETIVRRIESGQDPAFYAFHSLQSPA